MVKEIKGTKRNTDVINDLTMFYVNGGFINPGQPPKRNEPFYREYMIDKLINSGAKKGMFLRIVNNDTDTVIEGALLSDIHQHITLIELLIHGKKKWKNNGNIVYVSVEDIGDFSIVDKPPLTFENKIEWSEPSISRTVNKDDASLIINKYPDAMINEDIFLNITADIFCKPITQKYKSDELLSNTVISAHLVIVDKEGNTKTFDNLALRHVYLNRDYMSLCEGNDKTGNIILRYSTREELLNIAYVACTWVLSVNNDEVKIMNIVYPEFENNDKGPYIYNINLRAVSLNDEALSLHHHTVFSGETYTDYDCVGLSLAGESFIMVSGEVNSHEVMDIGLALHGGSMDEMIKQTCRDDYKEYAEVYVQKAHVGALSWLSAHSMSFDINKKQVDFSKIEL